MDGLASSALRAAAAPRAAEDATVFDRNCRREMRFFMVYFQIPGQHPSQIPGILAPGLSFLIEYARC
jgi:hypothetical protein